MLIALGVGVVTLIEYGVISPNLKVVYLNKWMPYIKTSNKTLLPCHDTWFIDIIIVVVKVMTWNDNSHIIMIIIFVFVVVIVTIIVVIIIVIIIVIIT
jgi:hypothetical protein